MKKPKILFAAAMKTELQPLLTMLEATKVDTLLHVFPLYKGTYAHTEIYIVETFVGDMNASVSSLEAIKSINPDYVIKYGAVGGSYLESTAGDIVVPLGFFHRTAWITKMKNGQPTNDAAQWQSVFGELPYQVNSENLGGLPYYYPTDASLLTVAHTALTACSLPHVNAYVGGGNMWMFDKKLLDTVGETLLPPHAETKHFVSDMESYAIAHACYLMKKPFIGCYTIASNDYIDEPYNPDNVPMQMKQLIPYTKKIIDLLSTL